MTLHELQSVMQRHILTGAPAVIPLLHEAGTASAIRRMAVYAEGYYARLLEVLGKDFPGLQALLGDAAFERLGRQYIAANPSRNFNARWVGQAFPHFLANVSGLSEHKVASEMATLEWAITLAFDAEDRAAVSAAIVGAIEPERWSWLVFKLHPSVQLFACHTNVLEIKRAQERGTRVPAPIDLADPGQTAVWRRDYRVFYRGLPLDEQQALALAREGNTFAAICDLLARHVDESAAALRAVTILRTWLDEQWLTDCTPTVNDEASA